MREVALCILRYLKKTLRQGLLFKLGKLLSMQEYFDVDWVGSIDDRCFSMRNLSFLLTILFLGEAISNLLLLTSVTVEYRVTDKLV